MNNSIGRGVGVKNHENLRRLKWMVPNGFSYQSKCKDTRDYFICVHRVTFHSKMVPAEVINFISDQFPFHCTDERQNTNDYTLKLMIFSISSNG